MPVAAPYAVRGAYLCRSASADDVAADQVPRDDPLQDLVGALEDLEDLRVAVDLLQPRGLARSPRPAARSRSRRGPAARRGRRRWRAWWRSSWPSRPRARPTGRRCPGACTAFWYIARAASRSMACSARRNCQCCISPSFLPNASRVRSRCTARSSAAWATPTPAARDADAPGGQRGQRDAQAAAGLAEDVVRGHLDVLEDDVGGDLAAVAHLQVRVADRHAGVACMSTSSIVIACSSPSRHSRQTQSADDRVGDPALAAVDHEAVVRAPGHGPQRGRRQVAGRVGLRGGEGEGGLAADQPGQHRARTSGSAKPARAR